MGVRRLLLVAIAAVATTVVPAVHSASADATSDQAKLKQIATQLAQLDQQNSALDDALLAAQQDAQQSQADVAVTQGQITDMQQKLGVVEGHVSELALQTFANGDSSGSLGVLLGDPSKLTSTVERDQYTKLAFSDGQDSIDQLGAAVDELNKAEAKLVKQQQVADKKSALVAAKQADLAAKSDALLKLKAATEAQFGKDQVAEAEAAQQGLLQASQASAAQAQAARAAANAGSDSTNGNGSSTMGGSTTGGSAKGSTAGGSSGSSSKGSTSGSSGGASGTSSKGSTSGSSAGTSPGGGHPAPAPSPGAGGAVAAALSQLGVPYHYAMATPGVGFDCSGLTSWAWGLGGKSIPHQSAQQYAVLPHVAQADVQAGDLLFFYSPISHVSIYVGGGMFVDAPNTGSFVREVAVDWSRVVGIARP